MSKAQLCPVCGGTGKITKQTVGTAGDTFEVTCHGCGGKGWVEVAEGTCPMYPCPTYIPPVYPYPDYPSTGDPLPPPPNTTWYFGGKDE